MQSPVLTLPIKTELPTCCKLSYHALYFRLRNVRSFEAHFAAEFKHAWIHNWVYDVAAIGIFKQGLENADDGYVFSYCVLHSLLVVSWIYIDGPGTSCYLACHTAKAVNVIINIYVDCRPNDGCCYSIFTDRAPDLYSQVKQTIKSFKRYPKYLVMQISTILDPLIIIK